MWEPEAKPSCHFTNQTLNCFYWIATQKKLDLEKAQEQAENGDQDQEKGEGEGEVEVEVDRNDKKSEQG